MGFIGLIRKYSGRDLDLNKLIQKVETYLGRDLKFSMREFRQLQLLREDILKLLVESDSPLETREIQDVLKSTRIKILYRLHDLRGEGLIKGKHVGSGKGTWIWWRKDAF